VQLILVPKSKLRYYVFQLYEKIFLPEPILCDSDFVIKTIVGFVFGLLTLIKKEIFLEKTKFLYQKEESFL